MPYERYPQRQHYMKDLGNHGHAARDTTYTPVANRAVLIPIQVPETVTINFLCFMTGSTSAGNVRMAIYRDNGSTPAGGALVVQTAAVAKGATYNIQRISIAATKLTKGLYWLAWASDETTSRPNLGTARYGWGSTTQECYFDLGSWTTFPATCPAISGAQDVPIMFADISVWNEE